MKYAGLRGWQTRWMSYGLICFCGVFTLLGFLNSTHALAGDWSIQSRLTEKASFDDNLDLKQHSDGEVYGSTGNLFLDLIRTSHTYQFDLIGDLGYSLYTGPGASDDLDKFTPRFETRFHKFNRSTTFDASAFYDRKPATTTDLIDTAVIPIDTIKETYGVDTSIERKINPRDTISISNSATKVDFSPVGEDATPTTSLEVSGDWLHHISGRTDTKATVGVEWLSLDDDQNTDRWTYRAKAGVTTDFTPRLKAHGAVGIRLVESHEDKTDGSDDSRETTFNIGPLADLGFDYTLKSTKISFSTSYGAQPNGTSGELQDRLTVGLGITHAINDLSQVSLNTQYQMTNPITGDKDEMARLFSVSPVYVLEPSRDWRLLFGYKFSVLEDEEGSRFSNNAFVSLSKAFTVMP